MGEKTDIQWTDSTWNPVWGCTKVSPGCQNCYAERIALSMNNRMHPMHGSMWRQGRDTAFKFRTVPNKLEEPLHWKTPRMVFVNSMSDLFHEDCPDGYIEQVWEVMLKADWHVYQILTKRPQRMAAWVGSRNIPRHIWLGTSVELPMYLGRLDELRRTRAPVKFVSFEPLLGSVKGASLKDIQWVITGGESDYRNPRPADANWFREIRDASMGLGIPYFHKQNGGKTKCECHGAWGCRLLDGKTYDDMPFKPTASSKEQTKITEAV